MATNWKELGECPRCGAPQGKPCKSVTGHAEPRKHGARRKVPVIQRATYVSLPGEAALYKAWHAGWDDEGRILLGFPGPKGHDRTMTYREISDLGGWAGPYPRQAVE